MQQIWEPLGLPLTSLLFLFPPTLSFVPPSLLFPSPFISFLGKPKMPSLLFNSCENPSSPRAGGYLYLDDRW